MTYIIYIDIYVFLWVCIGNYIYTCMCVRARMYTCVCAFVCASAFTFYSGSLLSQGHAELFYHCFSFDGYWF